MEWLRGALSSAVAGSVEAAPAVGSAVERATTAVRDTVTAMSASEAQYFDEDRFSENELRAALNDLDVAKTLVAMKRVLAGMSCGRDVEKLFPDVVKNVSTNNLELKKLVYIYLIQYAESHKDLALLAINSFQKDLIDRSQLVRAAALKAMASTRAAEVTPLVLLSVQKALGDSSGYVRKTAAMGLAKVYLADPGAAADLKKLLPTLLQDPDVLVVEAAVMAFSTMSLLEPDESFALLHPYFCGLCDRVYGMEAWAQVVVVDLLLRYCRTFFTKDSSSPHFAAAIGAFRALAGSTASSTVVTAVVATHELTGELPVRPLMRCFMGAADEDLEYVLPVLEVFAGQQPRQFKPFLPCFYLKHCDPAALKLTKLALLRLLVDELTVSGILKELQTYVCWRGDDAFLQEVVRTISAIALANPAVADTCLRGLVRLLDSRNATVSEESVIAVRLLLQQERDDAEIVSSSVAHLVHLLAELRAPAARASVIWLMGQYQHEIPFLAPDALRSLAKSFPDEAREVKLQTLPFAVKVWTYHVENSRKPPVEVPPVKNITELKVIPPQMSQTIVERLEGLLDHILELASLDAAWDLRDLTRYYKVLKAEAKAVLAGGQGGELARTGAAFCRALCAGQLAPARLPSAETGPAGPRHLVYSLAHHVGEPFESYRPLPSWAAADSDDALRRPLVQTGPTTEVRSLSSSKPEDANMPSRVQTKAANIAWKEESLEDLDLFYSEDKAPLTSTATLGLVQMPAESSGSAPAAMVDVTKLLAPQGQAVLGEEDESDSDWGDMPQ